MNVTLAEPPIGIDAPLEITYLRGQSALAAELRKDWEKMVHASGNPYMVYQSPEWWDHRIATGSADGYALAVIRDTHGRPQGYVPVESCVFDLMFSAKSRTFLRLPLRCVSVLGGMPLLPANREAHRILFHSLFDKFPECSAIYLKAVYGNTPCWYYLEHASDSTT